MELMCYYSAGVKAIRATEAGIRTYVTGEINAVRLESRTLYVAAEGTSSGGAQSKAVNRRKHPAASVN